MVATTGPLPYFIVNFSKHAKIDISMITQVLGMNKGLEIDEIMLGFVVSLCHPDTTSYSLFYFPQYLSNAIHHHLKNQGSSVIGYILNLEKIKIIPYST